VKYPFLLLEFDQTSTGCVECGGGGSVILYLSQPAAMLCGIGKKNCFGVKSKVPFVTARFRRNLHSVWNMESKKICKHVKHVKFQSHLCHERRDREEKGFRPYE
jgi:hypothetical protein